MNLEKLDFYYKTMDKLAEDLSKVMNQKIDAKTIVFAVKMFSY
jgi:DNA-(apurinic or apyrimidinic site) lyase